MVLVHHSLLLTPALMGVHEDPEAPRDALVQAVSATPLHLLWDGEVAVQVFFVLSGFVLTLAATRTAHRWGSSLYLVHEPVVVAVGYLTGWTSQAVLLLTVPLSLGLAEVFFRLVERPSHRLARETGAVAVRARAARP